MGTLTTASKTDIIEECLKALQADACNDDSFRAFEDAASQPGSDQARVYFQLGEALFARSNYDKATQYLEFGLGLARQRAEVHTQILALGLLAEIDRVRGQFRSAFARIDTALALLEETPDPAVHARLLLFACCCSPG